LTAFEYLKRALALSPDQVCEKAWWRLLRAGRRLRFGRQIHRSDVCPIQQMIDPALRQCRTPYDIYQQFREKSRPYFFFDGADRDRIVAQAQVRDPAGVAALIAEAERILANRIYVHGFGEIAFGNRITWFGSQHPYRDKLLSRHDFIPTLIQAYWYTSDCRFAEQTITLWREWIGQPDRLKLDNPVDNSIRIQNWLWMVYALRSEDFLNSTDIVHLLSEVYRSGFRIEADMAYAANHRVIEALGLWCIGVFFPELKRALYWRSKGEKIILGEMERQVFLDGVHREMSSGYHIFVTTHFLKYYILSRRNDYTVPEQFRDSLGRMLAFVEALRKPDGEMPMLGDSDALRTRDREHRESALLGPALSLFRNGDTPTRAYGNPGDLVPWYFGRLLEERSQMTTSEARPNVDDKMMCSRVFPNAGYVLMRTGSDSKCHYLLMDAGPFGMDSLGAHGHSDALHLEICAQGDSLVIDPGGYGYVADRWRQFFRSTRAHSTVEVDGRNQSDIFGIFGVGRTAQCTIATWVTTDRIDFVEAFHNGYQNLPSPVIHRRSVLFVKEPPSYWIIIDNIEGQGEHTLDLLFHLTPEARVRRQETGKILIQQSQAASTEIRSLMSPPDKPSVITGQLNTEIQGWVSRTTGIREAAPVLSFKKRALLPQMFATLIRPENSTNTNFEVRHLSPSHHRDRPRFAWELCWRDMSDKICMVYHEETSSGRGRLNASIERWVGDQSMWHEFTGHS